MRKGVNRNPSRRPGLAVSDSNLHAVKDGTELFALPRACALSRVSVFAVDDACVDLMYRILLEYGLYIDEAY